MLAWINLFIAFSALVLNFVVILSTNNGVNVTKHLNWGWGKCSESAPCNKVYVSIWDLMVSRNADDNTMLPFSASSCKEDLCDDCSQSNRAAITFASITLALITIGFVTNWFRTKSATNTSANKIISAITSLLAVFTGIISVISFSRGCFQAVMDFDAFDTDSGSLAVKNWYYGSAFILLVVALLLKCVDFVMNLVTPTDDASADSKPVTMTTKHEPVPHSV
jgi:hypothetical protein